MQIQMQIPKQVQIQIQTGEENGQAYGGPSDHVPAKQGLV